MRAILLTLVCLGIVVGAIVQAWLVVRDRWLDYKYRWRRG